MKPELNSFSAEFLTVDSSMFYIGRIYFSCNMSFVNNLKGKQYWFQVGQLVTSWLTWICIVCKNLNVAFGADKVKHFPYTFNLQQTTFKTNGNNFWKLLINERTIIMQQKKFENNVAKGDIADHEQFLILPQCFQMSASEIVYMFNRFTNMCDQSSPWQVCG